MAKQNSEYFAKYRLRRREMGLCRSCSEKVCERSTVYCEKCLGRLREGNRSRQHRYKTKYKGRNEYQTSSSCRYSHLKSRCKEKGIDLLISKEEFSAWFDAQPRVCHYCGISQATLNASKQTKKSLSLDRKNSKSGYEIGNICLACHRCNNCKSNFFTEAQWKEIASVYIKNRLDEWV